MKKIISLLLCAVLCLTLLPSAALAAEGTVTYAVTGGNLYFNTATGGITDCDTSVTAADIPSIINGVSVTSIGSYAFSGCYALSSVTIPDSVTSIKYYAFQFCTSLTSITIPDSVTDIGIFAFDGCSALIAIELSGDNQKYASVDGVLYNKDKTTLVAFPGGKTGGFTIPDSVTSIGEGAFFCCAGLTSVTIPNSVTYIGSRAFTGCDSLKEIQVDENNTNYTSLNGVLYNRGKTTLIKYPEGKSGAFTVPSGVTSIGDYAFEDCEALTSVTIPDSVTIIGCMAFSSCDALSSITIPNSVTSIGYSAFEVCTGLTSVTIPNSVTEIEYCAFNCCTGLTDVYYSGNETQWAAITIGEDNDPLTSATIHYNSTGPDSEDDTSVAQNLGVYDLFVSEKVTLDYTLSDGEYWVSADPALVSVDQTGTVESEKYFVDGSAVKIYVTDGKKIKCYCYVRFLPTMVDTTALTTGEEESLPFSYTTYGFFPVTWSTTTAGAKVVKIDQDNKKITGLSEGSAVLTGVTADGKHKISWTVVVAENELDAIFCRENATEVGYSRTLALWGAQLSNDIYTEGNLEKTLEENGYNNWTVYQYNSYFENPDRTYASKTLPNGKTLVTVVIKGTNELMDWITDLTSLTNGFVPAGENAYKDLVEYIDGLGIDNVSEDVVLFITGHSLGAATAGRLAQEIEENNLVPKAQTFVYTYASPNYSWDGGTFPNVVNIMNDSDVVTFLPHSGWKVGRNYCFTWAHTELLNPVDQVIENHSMYNTYYKAIEDEGRAIRTETTIKYIMEQFSCPVDVAVYNAAGEKIAYTEGENAYMADGADVLLVTNGDEKYLFRQANDGNTVKLTGTGDGTMTYTSYLLTQEGVEDSTTFENVALTEGKLMTSDVLVSDETLDVSLFVCNENGEATAVISENGTETALPAGDTNDNSASGITITRLFNPASGEHLLASSDAEIEALTSGGWSVDGVMCYMPTSGTPIYRLYNPTSGEHLYTMVTSEIETLTAGGWSVDGIIAYSADSSGTPIYRLYNQNAAAISSHLLSTSQTEIDTLTAAGWTKEGIALFASK